MSKSEHGLFSRLLTRISGRNDDPNDQSLLQQSSRLYADKPSEANDTMRTGFDPRGARLFRALVEAGFLIANADGHFDAEERVAFAQVVAEACDEAVTAANLDELTGDLALDLATSSIEERIEVVCAAVTNDEERIEVFRVAVVMAYASSGLSDSERRVLDQLAEGLKLDSKTTSEILQAASEQAVT